MYMSVYMRFIKERRTSPCSFHILHYWRSVECEMNMGMQTLRLELVLGGSWCCNLPCQSNSDEHPKNNAIIASVYCGILLTETRIKRGVINSVFPGNINSTNTCVWCVTWVHRNYCKTGFPLGSWGGADLRNHSRVIHDVKWYLLSPTGFDWMIEFGLTSLKPSKYFIDVKPY